MTERPCRPIPAAGPLSAVDARATLVRALWRITSEDNEDAPESELRQHTRHAGRATGIREMAEIAREALRAIGAPPHPGGRRIAPVPAAGPAGEAGAAEAPPLADLATIAEAVAAVREELREIGRRVEAALAQKAAAPVARDLSHCWRCGMGVPSLGGCASDLCPMKERAA